MLEPMFYWMPGVRRDIDRCLVFASRQPHGDPVALKSEIKRGVANICADPGCNLPEVKLVDSRLWLRRYTAAHTMIIYAYSPSKHPDCPGVVSIVAVRYMRVASATRESEKALAESSVPYEPETWDDLIDHEDGIDWDSVLARSAGDYEGQGHWFNFAEYATHEEATQALSEWIQSICKEVKRDRVSNTPPDAENRKRY